MIFITDKSKFTDYQAYLKRIKTLYNLDTSYVTFDFHLICDRDL